MSPRKVITLLLFLSASLQAGEFLRVQTQNQNQYQQSTLQTAVTTYIHPSGVQVTLIAAVHVGEKSYYQSIRDQINTSDSLVYEGIVRSISTIDWSDQWYTPLGLVSQQSILRFRPDNTVRGDLPAEEFDRIRKMPKPVAVPSSKNSFANQILFSMTDETERMNLDATCAITARNQAAIKSLQSRLARGDHRIAMLYGAAHCDDLENQLIHDLGFKRQSQSWLSVFGF